MWIVRLALRRPYTFVVMALLILIIGPLVIYRTPTDVFPDINIPVVSVIWGYTVLSADEIASRIVVGYERGLTATVNDIEHIESQSLNGLGVVKIYFHPNVRLEMAVAQVTALSQSAVRNDPPGTTPPFIITYDASSVPILQLALSGKNLSEQQLNDIGSNFIRSQLATVQGAVLPNPYGGKQRQVQVDLNMEALQAKGLSPNDVVSAIGSQNLILPAGTVKIGSLENDVELNSSPRTVEELNNLPIKAVGTNTIYIRDVAHVRDGSPPQTNVVHVDGQRAALMTVLKSGNASTLDVIAKVKDAMPLVLASLPPELQVRPIADQSLFVRASINGVLREAIIAACLTGIMILVFLGSWRSTLIIAVSIPLSILTSIIILSAIGETINIMTLGGLALAVGILVDDATVVIANINPNLAQGKEIIQAILDGAQQIAVPAFVSTLSICIVFVPMFFLTGVARYLFVPLAEAVVFAMLASYLLSRTLVPTMARFLVKAKGRRTGPTRNPFTRFQRAFERGFERVRAKYHGLLATLVSRRYLFIPVFLLGCLSASLLAPLRGQDFFPSTDSGQFMLHVRAKAGTRIEDTAQLTDLVEASIRQVIPSEEIDNILDNIGLPYAALNYIRNTSGVIGASDADILDTLKANHDPTADYVRELRKTLPRAFPGTTFYCVPADIVTQILNFGLPAPIDVQLEGADIEGNRQLADRMLAQLHEVPGLVDLRMQQAFDYPVFKVAVDRTKAAGGGFTMRDVASSLLVSLSGSFQTTPMFFLNWQNGVNYQLVTQAPQYDLQSLQALQNIPISGPAATRPGILADVASVTRSSEMAVVSHYNIRRVLDIYGAVQGRDLGAVGRDVARIVDANRHLLPRGSFITIRGQLATCRTSYVGLLAGLAGSIVLVYLLIVVTFQSWLDPFIIITALPTALAGIVVVLFLTHTTLI